MLLSQLHQRCSGVGDCRKPGFAEQTDIPAVQQKLQVALGILGSGMFVELEQLQGVDLAFKAGCREEASCSADFLDHEGVEPDYGVEDGVRKYISQIVASERSGDEK